MKIKGIGLIALLCIGLMGQVHAGEVVSQAYEVAFEDFRAPANRNGTAAFKPCRDCNYKVVGVSSDTRYQVNGKVVSFVEFKRLLEHGNNRTTDVIVLHHLKSNTIVSITVSL